jgi:hypothetical protein
MKRLQRRSLAPGEEVGFPVSLEKGDGIVALLDQIFGSARYAETARRIGLDGDRAIFYFIQLFEESARNLNISERQLQQTYEALSQCPDSRYVS